MGKAADKYLAWAFLAAIALHTAAVAAGTQLSAIRSGNGYLEDIQVFDSRAPIIVSPVTLVSWQDDGAGTAAALINAVAVTPSRPSAATQPPAPVRPVPTRGQGSRVPPKAGSVRPAAPSEGNRSTDPPGGGGGGPVDLGSPSPNGDLNGTGAGGTPVGDPPGAGTGSGAGSGSGAGPSPGQGSGDGNGAGTGEGGVANGGSPGNGSDQQFVSRVADRQQPEVIKKGVLTYPQGALEDGAEGTVQLRVLVTETGEVASVEVTRSSGDRRLDAAAKEFVRGWQYRPAVQDGKPRRVHSTATVVFELR